MSAVIGNQLRPLGSIYIFGAGFVSSGGGAAGASSPVADLLVSLVLGAFGGVILGLILSQFARFFSVLAGRNLGGSSWAIYGALLGALAMGMVWAAQDD